MKLLEFIHGRFLCRPAHDETFGVGSRRLRNDVEVDVIDLLVSNATVILTDKLVSTFLIIEITRRTWSRL